MKYRGSNFYETYFVEKIKILRQKTMNIFTLFTLSIGLHKRKKMNRFLHTLIIGTFLCTTLTAANANHESGIAAYNKGNYAVALSEFNKCISQSDCQYSLGGMYAKGLGVTQDYKEAARLYRLAAAKGNPMAQSNLGVLYLTGKGVSQDYDEAAFRFRVAADQGNVDALANLSVMYARGYGVRKNFVVAYVLANLAATNGELETSASNREIYLKRLTPSDISAAERLTSEIYKFKIVTSVIDRYLMTVQ